MFQAQLHFFLRQKTLWVLQYLREIIKSQDSGGSDGKSRAARSNDGCQGSATAASEDRSGFVLPSKKSQRILNRFGHGKACVIDLIAQRDVWEEVLPFVDMVYGMDHGLDPAIAPKIKPAKETEFECAEMYSGKCYKTGGGGGVTSGTGQGFTYIRRAKLLHP